VVIPGVVYGIWLFVTVTIVPPVQDESVPEYVTVSTDVVEETSDAPLIDNASKVAVNVGGLTVKVADLNIVED